MKILVIYKIFFCIEEGRLVLGNRKLYSFLPIKKKKCFIGNASPYMKMKPWIVNKNTINISITFFIMFANLYF